MRYLIKNTVKSGERKCKSKNQVHYLGREEGITQKKVFCLVKTYVWSLSSKNCASHFLIHLVCLFVISLSIYIVEALILANLHQSKASFDEHFKLDKIKPFWQQFSPLSKVVFKTLLDLQNSFNSKMLCFSTFLQFFKATLLTIIMR